MSASSNDQQTRILDFVILLLCVFMVAWLFNHSISSNALRAAEILDRGSIDQVVKVIDDGGIYKQAKRGYLLVYAVLLGFMGYSGWRLKQRPGAFRVLTGIAAPACVLGMFLSMSQDLSGHLATRAALQEGVAVSPSDLDARQMWAALLWTKSQTNALPAWSRGGMEQWPLSDGTMLDVFVDQNSIKVVHPGISSGLACSQFANALSDQRPGDTEETGVLLDGARATAGLCEKQTDQSRQFSLVASLARKA